MGRIALLSLALTLPALAGAQQAPVPQAVQSITPEDVRERIGVLAHDSMRGRNTPSPEIEKAAEYVAEQFRQVGLRPGGEGGSYIQRYPIHRVRLDSARSHIATMGAEWRFPRDVLRVFGPDVPEGTTGRLAVVSGVAGAAGATDLDLDGAVVLYVGPLGANGALDRGAQRTFVNLRSGGAVAVLAAIDVPDSLWAAQARNQFRPRVMVPAGSSGAPLLFVRDAAARALLASRGHDLGTLRRATALAADQAGRAQVSVTILPQVLEEMSAPNSVGILEGSDPALKDEYIVFSAHMDHVGVGRPVNGDSIYNGADDDASGTAAVIELAEAYAQLATRPKRSMIFLTVSGEEHGLWGSDYFAGQPPVPIEAIVANFNIDMIGRNWDDTVVVIGKEHSDLGATLNRVAAAHPELNMQPIDDIWPEENFYRRSDHFNFARRGVPVLFFFTGTHEDYHRPGDHVEKIDAEKQARIVRLIFYLGLEVANAADKPKWEPESYAEIVTER